MTGATTNSVTVQSGSTLNINGANITGNPGVQGITVNNSRAVIDRAVVTSDTIGLAVNRPNSATTGSTVSVSNSQISGGNFGAQVTGLSTLDLVNTQVSAAAGNGVGMNITGGDVRASGNSRILGATTGVRMANDPARVGANSLVLDGSSVEGVSGSAILVERGINAKIAVLNNSTLKAGNNTLLDVREASTASMTVGNSLLEGNIQLTGSTANLTFDQARLTGNVLADSGSSANVLLQNHSVLEGNVQLTGASGDVALDQSTMTGNVLADSGATTDVVLRNQALLNGNVQLTGNSTASLSLDQSQMTGDVLADSGSSANVLLQNLSVLDGNVQLTGALGELALDQSTMTGNVLADSGATADVVLRNHAQLNGNVQLTGTSTASLNLDQSRMTGDVLVESGSTANVTLNDQSQLIGRLNGVNGVTINSQSTWTLTGNDSIGALAMNGGTVDFGTSSTPGTFYQLNVGTLTGNGTFAMKGDFANGDRDFLNVSGVATGDFGLAISASGLDATSPQQLQVVHTGAGDARFSLVNGTPVDLGAFSYALTSESNGSGGTDWFLDPTTKTISPAASTVLALFNTAPTVWYGELSSLRSRMGELRFNGGQSGAWARSYGNKYNVAEASGVGYQQTQQGFSLGADARLGESQWLVGVLTGYSQSDLDLNRGTSGTVKSYYAGPYVTWLDADTGYYFDGVLKFNRFRNEAKVSLSDGSRSKGDYDTMGVGASAEFGRHIKLADGYFVEPFTQLSAVVIQGRHYDLDNGMDADGDRTRSLLGKLGTTAGRNIPLSGGGVAQPYVRAAWVHEFAKNNEVQVNNNVFNNDLSGSRGELGAGVAVSLSEQWQVHADFDYANGEHIEQPWGANVGVRYSW
ncbi:autotransporter outer membrane beta-barrel domain-containing protein [Pseudomonas frederiksbergensis]|uniref:autotransporter outer membrane beta-barrel domain-containing protein n=1 Tax=Pseudomonas frederiksbergensis TaxID=104087 RepID=UPI003D248C49